MQPGARSFQLRKSCSETQSKHLTGSSQNDAYELLSSWGDDKHQTPLYLFNNMGCFLENLGNVIDDHGESFHQDIKSMAMKC